VIDVSRQTGIRLGIVEGLREKDRVDGVGGRLGPPRARKILRECLAHEASERHPACPRRIGGTPVKLAREQQLSPVHV
jgi:hypothetical protein